MWPLILRKKTEATCTTVVCTLERYRFFRTDQTTSAVEDQRNGESWWRTERFDLEKDRKKKKKAKKKRKRTSDTPTGSDTKDKRTAAERAYDKVAEERELKKLKKLATVTHREKINQYNSYLASLSEHHDVPKVGNAGMG